MQPRALAAPRERSSCLPRINGPRSLIRTITDLPFLVKCSFVPNGSVLWAAVIPSGTNLSPFAVLVPWWYQEAFIVLLSNSVGVAAHPPRRSAPNKILHRIFFPFVMVLPTGNDPVFPLYQSDVLPLNYGSNGASGRTRTHIFHSSYLTLRS